MYVDIMAEKEISEAMAKTSKLLLPRTPEEVARVKAFEEKVKNLSSEDIKKMRQKWEEEHGEF